MSSLYVVIEIDPGQESGAMVRRQLADMNKRLDECRDGLELTSASGMFYANVTKVVGVVPESVVHGRPVIIIPLEGLQPQQETIVHRYRSRDPLDSDDSQLRGR